MISINKIYLNNELDVKNSKYYVLSNTELSIMTYNGEYIDDW